MNVSHPTVVYNNSEIKVPSEVVNVEKQERGRNDTTKTVTELEPVIDCEELDEFDETSVELAKEFTTDSVIEHQIKQFRDDGREINMQLLDELWKAVYKDIVEQHYAEIFSRNVKINTQRFRMEIAAIVGSFLRDLLQEVAEIQNKMAT